MGRRRYARLALVIPAAAFLAGLIWARQAQVAQAKPIEVLAVSPSICLSLLLQLEPDLVVPLQCFDMASPLSLATVAGLAVFDNDVDDDGLFGVDDTGEVRDQLDARDGVADGKFRIRPDDFGAIDLDADQLHQEDGVLFILAFVNDDDPVTFETTVGTFDNPPRKVGDEHEHDDDWVCDTKTREEDCDGMADFVLQLQAREIVVSPRSSIRMRADHKVYCPLL